MKMVFQDYNYDMKVYQCVIIIYSEYQSNIKSFDKKYEDIFDRKNDYLLGTKMFYYKNFKEFQI